MVKLTKIILVSLAVFLIGYDIYIYFTQPPESLISVVVKSWSFSCPFVALMIGILGGHFFFPSKNPKSNWKSFFVMVVIVVVISATGLVINKIGITAMWARIAFFPGTMFLLGIPLGIIFWQQQDDRGV